MRVVKTITSKSKFAGKCLHKKRMSLSVDGVWWGEHSIPVQSDAAQTAYWCNENAHFTVPQRKMVYCFLQPAPRWFQSETGRLKQSSAVDEPPLPTHSWTGPLPRHFLLPFSQSQGSSWQVSLWASCGLWPSLSSHQNYTHLLLEWIHLFHCEEGIMKFLLKLSLGELSEFATHLVETQTVVWAENTRQGQSITQLGGGWQRDFESRTSGSFIGIVFSI